MKSRLMTGTLKPGDTLKLRSISETFGTSQTPVREALLQLVSERALAMSPGKSITVPILGKNRLQELRDIRLCLEMLATERATPLITGAEISKLQKIHKKMHGDKLKEEKEGVLSNNWEFHFVLYQASRMPELLAIIEGLWAQTGPSLSYLYRKPFVHLYDEHPHLQLIEALKRHDVPAAVAAIKKDVAGYGAALMDRMFEVVRDEAGSQRSGLHS